MPDAQSASERHLTLPALEDSQPWRYTAAEYGLSVEAIREEYADYIRAYDVEVERSKEPR